MGIMSIPGKEHVAKVTPHIDPIKVPTSIDELAVPSVVIENLVLKHLSAFPKSDMLTLSKRLGVITSIIETVLSTLKKRSEIEVFQPTEDSNIVNLSHNHVRYSLSEKGRVCAELAFRKDPYLGPAPVSWEQYCAIVKSQDFRTQAISRADVEQALKGVSGAQNIIPLLGPAINSGRAILLYGHAGTGKTFVASKVNNALQTSVYIPFAVYAFGNVIKVYSTQHHKHVEGETGGTEFLYKNKCDNRWILCERPNIQVGGELTMEMLEVNHAEHNRVWLAPIQMMANNGTLIIDDLGRQPIPVDTLLNRWIVPMEYFVDQLSLPNGQQITIPFVLTLAFSTNLNPEQISDPAFLRRLGYKIKFSPISKEDYELLWLEIAKAKGVDIPEETLCKVIDLHKKCSVSYFPCLPKDLVGISCDMIQFDMLASSITPDVLERAWQVYFTED